MMLQQRLLMTWMLAMVLGFGVGLSAQAMDEAAPEGDPPAEAAEAEQVTLTGKMTCAKCEMGEADKCQSVLIVGDTTYYLAANEANKGAHKKVCMKGVEGVKVTGTVSEGDDGKKTLTASKIEMPKGDAEA